MKNGEDRNGEGKMRKKEEVINHHFVGVKREEKKFGWMRSWVGLVSQTFSQFCHNSVMWRLVSGEIMNQHRFTILFPPLTSCYVAKLG